VASFSLNHLPGHCPCSHQLSGHTLHCSVAGPAGALLHGLWALPPAPMQGHCRRPMTCLRPGCGAQPVRQKPLPSRLSRARTLSWGPCTGSPGAWAALRTETGSLAPDLVQPTHRRTGTRDGTLGFPLWAVPQGPGQL
jgi:hypothetical protein